MGWSMSSGLLPASGLAFFLQIRNGCGMQQASDPHLRQHIHSPANARRKTQLAGSTFHFSCLEISDHQAPFSGGPYKEIALEASLVVQWLSLCASPAGAMS